MTQTTMCIMLTSLQEISYCNQHMFIVSVYLRLETALDNECNYR